MQDLPLGRIATLVPEFAVKDLPLGRTLMMMKVIKAIAANVVCLQLQSHGFQTSNVKMLRIINIYFLL